MNLRNPKASVLMPVYNGEQYLRESIESILNQTLRNFEFLIISEHGSSDESLAIILSYSDERIRHIHNVTRIGLVGSLNLGLKEAKGEYIARMDSDDISYENRLEKQVDFLNKHPEIGIAGTAYQMIDINGCDLGLIRRPLYDLHIRWTCLLDCPFAHPTVMIRQNVLIENKLCYDETLTAVEDYGLWTRILEFTQGANLDEPLLRYRVHSDNVSNKNREIQLKNHDIIAFGSIHEQLPEFNITPEQVTRLRRLFVGGSRSVADLDKERVILAEIYLDMFKVFMYRNSQKVNLKELQHQEGLKIALVALNKPFRFKWVPIFWRLIKMDTSLLWIYPGFLLKTTFPGFVQRVKELV